jgi:hypothetical protein
MSPARGCYGVLLELLVQSLLLQHLGVHPSHAEGPARLHREVKLSVPRLLLDKLTDVSREPLVEAYELGYRL